jgi:hypothetical protein
LTPESVRRFFLLNFSVLAFFEAISRVSDLDFAIQFSNDTTAGGAGGAEIRWKTAKFKIKVQKQDIIDSR